MTEVARDAVPQAEFVVGDTLDLPFPDKSFERVFEPEDLLAELGGGRVIQAARWSAAVASP